MELKQKERCEKNPMIIWRVAINHKQTSLNA